MIKFLPKIIFYNLFYYFGWPKILPLNITLSLSYKCNSRCRTCHIWQRNNVKELTLEEYEKIFANIGQWPYEIILTGGEPFLRKEIVEICRLIGKYIKPKVIIIPTNGILSELILGKTEEILKVLPRTKIIVNLSLDGIGGLHDEIRGVPGNFEMALKTFGALRALDSRYDNFDLKVHTVISKFNINEIPRIYEYIKENFKTSSFITEIAEERAELNNIDSGISPSAADYIKAINFLMSEIKKEKFSGLNKITQAFRMQYYKLVKRILTKRKQIIPCLAALASVQITPDGEVWACCIKAESMGNLREKDYDFKEIWRGKKAEEIRKKIKKRKCYCPLANASYTNMLCHPFTLFKIILELL